MRLTGWFRKPDNAQVPMQVVNFAPVNPTPGMGYVAQGGSVFIAPEWNKMLNIGEGPSVLRGIAYDVNRSGATHL